MEDSYNFDQTVVRRHRNALQCFRTAITEWSEEPRLDFVADLGDEIDQNSSKSPHSALATLQKEWARLLVPSHRLLGNHELQCFARSELEQLFPSLDVHYHSFPAAPGWRVIQLDAFDLNMIERGGGPGVEEAISFLSQYNHNDLRAPRNRRRLTDYRRGLEGLQQRFVPMGGAVREEQLAWLRGEMLAAKAASERVIVLTHVPLLPAATVPEALLWNHDEVLDILRREGQGTVALVLAGHYHAGGYGVDEETGTHHVTLPSPLHADLEDLRAHCLIEGWEDRLEISGAGLVPSRSLLLPQLHRDRHVLMRRIRTLDLASAIRKGSQESASATDIGCMRSDASYRTSQMKSLEFAEHVPRAI